MSEGGEATFRARARQAFSPREGLRQLLVPPKGRLAPLDGVRALSILWVVVFHAGWFARFYVPHPTWAAMLVEPSLLPLWRGDFGVDLFFVLSGFLIGGMLQDEIASTGTLSLGRFYVRRLMRLWPALLATAAIDQLFGNDHPGSVWPAVLYVANLVPVERLALGWTWSLALEEQFYLLCPWLLIALRGASYRGRIAALLSLAAALIGATAAVVVTYRLRPWDAEIVENLSPARWAFAFDHLYDKPWTRGSALLLGVVGAMVVRAEGPMKALASARRWPVVALLAALAAMALATHWQVVFGAPRALEVLYLASFRTLFAAGAAYLITLSLSDHPSGRALGRLLSHRALYPVAQLAYSAYLLNPIVCTWVHPRLAPLSAHGVHPLWLFVPADLLVTFGSAALLHVAIERPFMRLRPAAH